MTGVEVALVVAQERGRIGIENRHEAGPSQIPEALEIARHFSNGAVTRADERAGRSAVFPREPVCLAEAAGEFFKALVQAVARSQLGLRDKFEVTDFDALRQGQVRQAEDINVRVGHGRQVCLAERMMVALTSPRRAAAHIDVMVARMSEPTTPEEARARLRRFGIPEESSPTSKR